MVRAANHSYTPVFSSDESILHSICVHTTDPSRLSEPPQARLGRETALRDPSFWPVVQDLHLSESKFGL